MKNKQRSYTKEFREEAIKLALNSASPTKTAKELGIPVSTVHSWINQAKVLDFTPSSRSPDSQVKITMNDLLERNKELKKRISRLEQEKAILKKAATYFAKEIG